MKTSKPVREKEAVSGTGCTILVSSFLLCHCVQSIQGCSLKEDFFFLTSSFREIHLGLLGPMCSGRAQWQCECVVEEFLHVVVGKKQTVQRPGTRYPRIPFPLAVFHLLKFLEHLRKVKPPGDQFPCT